MTESTTSNTAQTPFRRRVLFTGLMLLVPVLFFVLLEVSLRLAGYGGSYPLFEEVPGYEDYRYQNRNAARRYFHDADQVPTGLSDAFRAEKDSSIVRLVVQGGSSAAGYPYYYGGSFSRMLEQRLQQSFPDRTIEVVNTSLAAVNSYTLRDFTDEILEIQPDYVLIYAGHNEYYGALGVGSSESIGRRPSIVNLYLKLQNLRIVQGLRDVMAAVAGWAARREPGAPPPATLMERMVAEQRIPYGSDLYRAGLHQFRTNLHVILDTYRREGVPVFIGTLASNERDQPPFIGGPAETAHDSLLAAARRMLRAGRPDAADSLATVVVAADSSADAFYTRARIRDRRNQADAAAADYTRAKDRDQLRFRASEDINRIILDEAEQTGASVVQVRRRLQRESDDGIIGRSLMLEHLHPNIDGYFLIADAFYDALRFENAIGPWTTSIRDEDARNEVLLTKVDSLYGAFRVRQLTASWPFAPPGTLDHSLDTLSARTVPEGLALGLLRSTINWYEATDSLRMYYSAHGALHEALQASLAMIQQYPFLPMPYAYAGEALANQGRLPEARQYFLAALDREESVPVLSVLASLNAVMDNPLDARANLERILELRPDNVNAHIRLAALLLENGARSEAGSHVEAALREQPDHPGALDIAERLGLAIQDASSK